MDINTYLNFNGDCRQAFEFYRSVFGGEFAHVATFGEGPPDFPAPENEKDRIMHVSLPIGSGVLMGSDTSSAFGPPGTAGNNFSISVAPIAGRKPSVCSTRCRRAEPLPCPSVICSGERILARASTNSESTGW